jgi:hypothetical protein
MCSGLDGQLAMPSAHKERAAMQRVDTIAIHKIGKPRRTPYAGHGYDILVRQLQFLQQSIVSCKNGVVSTTLTPGGCLGSEDFFGELVLKLGVFF